MAKLGVRVRVRMRMRVRLNSIVSLASNESNRAATCSCGPHAAIPHPASLTGYYSRLYGRLSNNFKMRMEGRTAVTVTTKEWGRGRGRDKDRGVGVHIERTRKTGEGEGEGEGDGRERGMVSKTTREVLVTRLVAMVSPPPLPPLNRSALVLPPPTPFLPLPLPLAVQRRAKL